MEQQFWHERWSSNQVGFHEPHVNPLLLAHVAALGLSKGARIFLPLCGKTLDIDWLQSQGYRVAGAELSPLAITQLFERLGVTPTIAHHGGMELRSCAGVDMFVGDIFALTRDMLGDVDVVYDRAALIALPADMRKRYVQHLASITGNAAQLLIAMEYDQARQNGPPFSVNADEVRALYSGRALTLLASQEIPGGLKGRCPATENVWLVGAL